jgi:hypothetical protein
MAWRARTGMAEVEGFEGVGPFGNQAKRGVIGLVRLWECVEKVGRGSEQCMAGSE